MTKRRDSGVYVFTCLCGLVPYRNLSSTVSRLFDLLLSYKDVSLHVTLYIGRCSHLSMSPGQDQFLVKLSDS